MRLQLAKAAAFIGLIASQIHAAQAVDIYSNLGTPDSSSNAAIGYNSVVNFDVTYAQGFTTGASLYLLDSVDLPLGVTGAGDGSPKLRIFSNNAGTPGTDLGVTFTVPAFGAQAIYNFSLNTPFALSASTTYWIVLSDTSASTQTKFNWYFTDTFSSPTAKNSSGVSFLGGARSNNGGALWSTNNGFAQTGITLNATAVPEPTTYALAAIATGVIAAIARRRKARKG